jgi:hypothetical protein|tara:strand:+ start:1030 stop:1236 length:207 start_codon:yes stop_codon:yes gene_type:complete
MAGNIKADILRAYEERQALQDLLLKLGISHDAAGQLWGMKSSRVRHMLRGHKELPGNVRQWVKDQAAG